MVKRIQKLTKKALKSPNYTDTGPGDSGNDDEESEPVVKKHQSPQSLLKQTQRSQETQKLRITYDYGFKSLKSLKGHKS